MFLSEGLVITGISTGHSASPDDLQTALNASSLPVLIGSGVRRENFADFLSAHGIIIGSYFKKDGVWSNELCETRLKDFLSVVESLREK